MAQSPYAAGKYTEAICDRCGFRYRLKDLRFESLSAKGVPSNQSSELRVCPTCFDPPHPQSFLPLVAAAHGADPEAIWKPRPDVYPIAYSLAFSPASIPQGTLGIHVFATGVFGPGPYVGFPDDPNIDITSIQLISPTKVLMIVNVGASAVIGRHTISIVDSTNSSLRGLLSVTQGIDLEDGLWGNEMFDDTTFGGPTS
jgi:hypothetical protein